MIRKCLPSPRCAAGLAVLLAMLSGSACAQALVVGISLSKTGQAATLGIPAANAVALLPAQIAGVPTRYVVLDDASDPTQASKNARQLVEGEKADILVGTVTVPGNATMATVAAESKVALLGLAPYIPTGENTAWTFQLNQPSSLMAAAVYDRMRDRGVKTLGLIAFSGTYGDDWLREAKGREATHGFKVVAAERYERTDISVSGQVLKLLAARPDAVLIAAGGSPAALPQMTLRERGYKGEIYQTHGAVNADFLRLSGQSGKGVVVPAGPIMVAEQLPDSHPSKALAVGFNRAYEDKYGAGSRNAFAGFIKDAQLILERAVPQALGKAQPGTPAFRTALRDAVAGIHDLPLTHGVYTVKEGARHEGFDERGRVLLTVDDGRWKLLEP